jgi:broad specificity phosphatase PhoE
MPTRVFLVEAGPTPWDVEQRISGAVSLPLTAEAIDAVRHLIDGLDADVAAVYRHAGDEACDETAKLIANKFGLRPRDNADLQEVNLGLWQGLTQEELRSRFTKAFDQWEENPLTVTPPDGEPLTEAFDRIADAIKRILRRNKDLRIAIALRPMALQICAGVLRNETPETISTHLHQRQPIATIDVK